VEGVAGSERSPPVVLRPAVERRARAYEELAKARGLEHAGRVDAHGVHFRGVHRGRDTLFTTGVLPEDRPTYPELQVWTEAVPVVAPVLLTPTSSAAPCSPEIAALLGQEDVHNVGVTDRFVRIRFEPGTPVTSIEHAWDALEVALAALEREAIDGGAPYRG